MISCVFDFIIILRHFSYSELPIYFNPPFIEIRKFSNLPVYYDQPIYLELENAINRNRFLLVLSTIFCKSVEKM